MATICSVSRRLSQINKDTVKRLIPVWNYSFDDNQSEESQPLIYKEGVLYNTTNSATMAVDAKTGKQILKTKVEYPPETPRIVCCGHHQARRRPL